MITHCGIAYHIIFYWCDFLDLVMQRTVADLNRLSLYKDEIGIFHPEVNSPNIYFLLRRKIIALSNSLVYFRIVLSDGNTRLRIQWCFSYGVN